jgi:phosphoglycerate dehydrogenase-like enzyme
MGHAEFVLGVTGDLQQPDGAFLFAPAVDLTALDLAGGVNWRYLADTQTLGPRDLEGLDAVLHLSPTLNAASLDKVERLALVARSGVGLDNIDLDACTAHGVAVTITPEPVSRSMASGTVAFLLALAHRLVERNEAFRRGEWDEGRNGLIGLGLTGRTLGLIGFGRIGREIARLLAPFEMRIIAYTPRLTHDEAAFHGVGACGLDDLLLNADFVVVVCPLIDETRGLLNARRLRQMKQTAFLINLARGPIVVEEALVRALEEGAIAGAALDVFEREPLPPDSPIARAPHVIGAPHSIGFTEQLVRGCIGSACESILSVARGVTPKHIANPAVLEHPSFQRKMSRFARDSSRA